MPLLHSLGRRWGCFEAVEAEEAVDDIEDARGGLGKDVDLPFFFAFARHAVCRGETAETLPTLLVGLGAAEDAPEADGDVEVTCGGAWASVGILVGLT